MTDNRPAHAPTGPGWYWLRNGEKDKIRRRGYGERIDTLDKRFVWMQVEGDRSWCVDGCYWATRGTSAFDIVARAEPPEEQPESSTDILSPVGRAGLELLRLAGSKEQAVKVIEQVEQLKGI